MQQRGQFPADFQQTEAFYSLHRELQVGFYLQGYFPFHTRYDESVEVRQWHEGLDRHRLIRTPAGELHERWTTLPEAFTQAPTEHLIKSPKDLAALRWLYEHTSYECDYAEAERRSEWVRDLGIVLCYTPKTPLMQLVALDAGIETITDCLVEAEEELDETLEIMETHLDQAVEIALSCPGDALMIPENLSSEVVGKRLFEKHMRRCQHKWTQRIAGAGKFSFIHIDGSLRGLLAEEGSVGFTVLEALTPSPVGDVAMSEMRELAGPEPILWGGLPGVYFTPLVGDEAFEAFVVEVLEVMRRDGRCVLGVADQVPPDGLRERVRRVAELAEAHGRYP